MFGNIKGWLVSIVMFAVTGYFIYASSRPPQPTTVTSVKKFAAALKPVKIDYDFSKLFPPGAEDKDAGDLIRACEDEAHTAFLENKFEKLDKAMAEPDPKSRHKARRDAVKSIEFIMDHLVEATKCNKMTLCTADKIVRYDNKPYLKYLMVLGKNASVAGRGYWTSGTPEEKEKGKAYIIAAFNLGRFLYQDRQILKECNKGLEIMMDAVFNYGVIDPSKRAECDQLTMAIDSLRAGIANAYGVMANPNENSAPGEIFLIAADKSIDPMWRVEATLKLGRMRWLKGVEYADQQHASEVLAEIAAEPNLPANVKVAVGLAQQLTAADMSNLMDTEP